jgi:hypothetical protein
VALLVVFGVTMLSFAVLQWRLGDGATIPFRIIRQRSIWAASWFGFFLSGAFFSFICFLPIYFQAIQGVSALQSGIDNLPLILANVITTISSGVAVSKLGYITPFCCASAVLASIGSGLLTTLTANTAAGNRIGYQILFGIGCGLGFQQPPNAAQAVLAFKDLPVGIALTIFFRNFGTALFVAAGNNVLDDQLLRGLEASALPGVNPHAVLSAGATSFRSVVPPSVLAAVVAMYEQAVQKTFQAALIISCISVVGAVMIEWKSIKGKKRALPAAGGAPSTQPVENTAVEKA